MRKSFAVFVMVAVATTGSTPILAQGQGTLNGVAQSADKAPLPNYRVHVRNANTGELAGSTTSNQAGQFTFASLQPGNYVVEIVDAAGKVVGLSPSIDGRGRRHCDGDRRRDGGRRTRGRGRWRPEPARPRTPRQRGGRGRGQCGGGDGGCRHPRRQARRLPQGVGHGFADARDRRNDAGQPPRLTATRSARAPRARAGKPRRLAGRPQGRPEFSFRFNNNRRAQAAARTSR